VNAAAAALELVVDDAAALLVDRHARWAGRSHVEIVAPLHQLEDRRLEAAALVGQDVFGMTCCATLHDALAHEAVEALGEHVLRDAETALELGEASDPEQRVAHDQQCPTLADHFERPCHGAHLAAVFLPQHGFYRPNFGQGMVIVFISERRLA
jgi:hypothetical protein